MPIKTLLEQLLIQQDLSSTEMTALMRHMMQGELAPAQIAAVLTALRIKGETVEEITAAAQVMRTFAKPIKIRHAPLVDTCGTGGDGQSLFNVSTACAFVVAAGGGYVAKHGNRSTTGQSGSADVLEAAGVDLKQSTEQITTSIETLGIGFMFAPSFHPAMQYAGPVRRELGFRTLFNLLGPLTNPANAKHQLLGVYSKEWVRPIAEVLSNLGIQHAMVVHAVDGLDELSLASETFVCELNAGDFKEYCITPEAYGIRLQPLDPLVVKSPQESLYLIESAFNNESGPALDMILYNAGAALYVADLASTLAEGVEMADALIAHGSVKSRWQQFIKMFHTSS